MLNFCCPFNLIGSIITYNLKSRLRILKTCSVSLNLKPNGLELNELILKVKIKKIIMRVWFADNCSLAVFLLNIDNPAPSIIIFGILSILFIALVGLDKLIVFRKVLGMERMVCQAGQIQPGPVNHQEYMLTMKKFSTSDIHFKMTIYIPLTLLGLGLLLFKNIYSVILQDSIAVSKSSKSTWINFSPGPSISSSLVEFYVGDSCTCSCPLEIRADSSLHCEACERMEAEYEQEKHSSCGW